ncbi:phosphoglycerol transferase MdoB-like AlkP superfamily enzyme [Anaerobacterium chartisolvens]|uniref:Phosphoglycerol transferase MdoB-like AlkP superfamily enzyme n=1 Tax=Anaerobacterium chartisolvens TaxID=1297424 RepID=A0A369B1J9_9FIRM|nr:LTA synthase family protein [Anaerobacterium chartisolvens]RCX14306.1 phosphoglycerol transferase MdoB-like AlkP superfamily enzyme [Anaerobacterium chartisolvens]
MNITAQSGKAICPDVTESSRRISAGAASAVVVFFILLNSVKITMFNFLIMESQTVWTFAYKLFFTLLFTVLVFYTSLTFKKPHVIVIAYIIQTAYIITMLCYYNYFRNYLHLFQVTALFTEGITSVKHFTIPWNNNLLTAILDLPLFLYVLITYKKISTFKTVLGPYLKYILIAPAVLIAAAEGWSLYSGSSIVHFSKDYSAYESAIVEKYGTLANSLCDIITNKGGKNHIQHLKYGGTITATAKETAKPNFVIIQVESMDSNVVNHKYKGKYIAPYLHSVSQSSVYYPYTMSYHKSGGTSDSEFSVINSVEPLGNFPSIKLSDYSYPNSMLKRLSSANYASYAFHGNTGSFYNRNVAFDKMGFDTFYDINAMGMEDEGWGAPDHEVFDFALRVMENEEKPFISYIITMTSHMPFTNAENYYKNDLYDSIEDETVKNYFNSISYVDSAIKDFAEQISTRFENTYIIIYGDHTPNIITPEYTQASFETDGSYFEFVPLIIITPDRQVYHEKSRAACFLDVAPTVLNASGISFEIQSKGMDLINPVGYATVPFYGNDYNRAYLYERVTNPPEE